MLKQPNQPSTSYFTKCHHEIWCWRMSKLALACGGSMICTCLIPILFAKKDWTISWNFQMIYQKHQCLPPCHQQVKLNAWTRPITTSSIYGRSNWKTWRQTISQHATSYSGHDQKNTRLNVWVQIYSLTICKSCLLLKPDVMRQSDGMLNAIEWPPGAIDLFHSGWWTKTI